MAKRTERSASEVKSSQAGTGVDGWSVEIRRSYRAVAETVATELSFASVGIDDLKESRCVRYLQNELSSSCSSFVLLAVMSTLHHARSCHLGSKLIQLELGRLNAQ